MGSYQSPNSVGAMRSDDRRSGVPSGTEPVSRLGLSAPAAIAGPTRSFVSLTRNPDLVPPARFEPTMKGANDVVI